MMFRFGRSALLGGCLAGAVLALGLGQAVLRNHAEAQGAIVQAGDRCHQRQAEA